MIAKMDELALKAGASFIGGHIEFPPGSGDWVWYEYKHIDYNDMCHREFMKLIVEECFKAAMIESKGHMNPVDLMNRMKEMTGLSQNDI